MKLNHDLFFMIIDSKICNSLTDNSLTQKCYICGVTCKDFNDIKEIRSDNLQL